MQSIINQTLTFYSFKKRKMLKKPKINFKQKQKKLLMNLEYLIVFLNENKNTLKAIKEYKRFMLLMQESIEVEHYTFTKSFRHFTFMDLRFFLINFKSELKSVDARQFSGFIYAYLDAFYQIATGVFGSFFSYLFKENENEKSNRSL